MRIAIWATIAVLLLAVIVPAGTGAAAEPTTAELKQYADMTENMLSAMNANDYGRFSRDFDEPMKATMTKARYDESMPVVTAKLGKYQSKDFVALERQTENTVVTYRAVFAAEPAGVIIRSVFSEKNGRRYVAGFWLDSPKLREK